MTISLEMLDAAVQAFDDRYEAELNIGADTWTDNRESALLAALEAAEAAAWRPGSDGSSLNPDERVLVEFGTRPDIVIGHWSESAALEMDGNGWLGDGGCWLSDVCRFRPLPVPPAAETEQKARADADQG